MITPSPTTPRNDPALHRVVGTEWVIDAMGCDPEHLRDLSLIRSICDCVITDLSLNVVGTPACHPFPFPGGVTTLYLLSESHLACHTYPEYSLATFNLYCCRNRDPWDWQKHLANRLNASEVTVRSLDRGQLDRGQCNPVIHPDHTIQEDS